MNDTTELFAALRKAGQQKRANNRLHSTEQLRKLGIPFTSHNNGAHLQVRCPDMIVIDFWPGTGLWKTPSGSSGRGIRSLLKELEKYVN